MNDGFRQDGFEPAKTALLSPADPHLPHHLTALHHRVDLLEHRHIRQRITRNRDHIRPVPRRQRTDGEPARAEYRTFKVKTVENNDFASMYEVLSRRLRRARTWLAQPSARGRTSPQILDRAPDSRRGGLVQTGS